MEPANQGYSLFPSKGVMFMHCGDDCKAIIENALQFSVKILPVLQLGHNENNLVLVSTDGCFSSVLSAYTVVQVIICMSVETVSVEHGRPFAIIQFRTTEQHFFLSAYLADDFSPTEPVYDFPPGFSFELLKDNDIISQVVKMSLQHTEISSLGHLFMKASEVDGSYFQHHTHLIPRNF